MSSSVVCRYYLQGACAFGDKCRFSHSRESSDEPSNVCRYYLAGNCAYGDKCRYQHSKPGWSGRGQAASASSNYSAPSGVPKPPVGGSGAGNMVKLPSGASEFGMVEAAPNWDDYMTPDEMDEFEQWQNEQAMAAAGGGGQGSVDDGDIMDPADIPLCNEYAATGGCSAGEECCYIHGDQCEICGYFCIHPYNPDVTAHHQAVCSEAMAAAAAGGDGSCNGSAPAAAAPAGAPQGGKKAAAAAAAADSSAEDTAAAEGSAAVAAAGGEGEEGKEALSEGAAVAEMQNGKEEGEKKGDAVDAAAAEEGDKGGDGKGEGEAAAADKLADKLAQAKVDS